jgi:hypothetical protein
LGGRRIGFTDTDPGDLAFRVIEKVTHPELCERGNCQREIGARRSLLSVIDCASKVQSVLKAELAWAAHCGPRQTWGGTVRKQVFHEDFFDRLNVRAL